MNLDLGPMISAVQRDRVKGFVDSARRSGIPVLAEGRLANDLPSGGFYVTPTLFGPVPRGNALACDEVFGPVLSAYFRSRTRPMRSRSPTRPITALWRRYGQGTAVARLASRGAFAPARCSSIPMARAAAWSCLLAA